MPFLLAFLIFFFSVYIFFRFTTTCLAVILKRYLRCKSVRINNIGFFYIKETRISYENGITVEIQNFRIGSSLFSQDYSKPIYLVIDDIRVSGDFNCSHASIGIPSETIGSERYYQLIRLSQYFGAKIVCANIIVYEALPNSLLMVSIQEISFETYYIKKGLQFEVIAQSMHTRFLARNAPGSLQLLDSTYGLSYTISIDFVNQNALLINKIELLFLKPTISISNEFILFAKKLYNFFNEAGKSAEKFVNISMPISDFLIESDEVTILFPSTSNVLHTSYPVRFFILFSEFQIVPNNIYGIADENKTSFRLSLKKFRILAVVLSSLYTLISFENFVLNIGQTNNVLKFIDATLEHFFIGYGNFSEIKFIDPVQFLKRFSGNQIQIIKCGSLEEFLLSYSTLAPDRRLVIQLMGHTEFVWSTSIHLIFHELYKHIFASFFTKDFHALSSSKKAANNWITEIKTESSLHLSFELSGEHYVRFVSPSLSTCFANERITIITPNLLLEMDENIIMNVENFNLKILQCDATMDSFRHEFKELYTSTNRSWLWNADEVQIVFPFGYNFAAAFDEIINSIKWLKIVHNLSPKPFDVGSPLPSDFQILINRFSLKFNDDPFEIRLHSIYEVQMDEYQEREWRRILLEDKILQLKADNPLIPQSKIDGIYTSLSKKNSEIYTKRIQEKLKSQNEKILFHWVINCVEIRAFADKTLNGKDNVIELIRAFNKETFFSTEKIEFSTLWARAVEFSIGESSMNFRDYPMPYMRAKDTHFWGILVGAEAYYGGRTVRQSYISAPDPWGVYSINRNMSPLKFYYDLGCEFSELNAAYGPCWEPCLSQISQCWNLVNAPSKDPSESLPFWDKIRLLLHGRISMMERKGITDTKIVTSMLASTDPYDDKEMLEIVWKNFAFDWLSGEFRIKSDIDVYLRTASKYDDSKLVSLPDVKINIHLDWNCFGNQFDHHSVHPCSPDKLPHYPINFVHDTYRAFRSTHVDCIVRFESKQASASYDRNPQISFYANTFKCLDALVKTLMTINPPVKRGKLFGTQHIKRKQLSRHLKNVQLNAILPRFLISYWMSFSDSHGFKVISDSLHLTLSLQLQMSFLNDAKIRRRPKIAWNVSHTSAQLDKTQVHLFDKQPYLEDGSDSKSYNPKISDKTFFAGLSRLIYICESSPNRFIDAPDFSTSILNPVNRLTVHELKGSWTISNRDICLVIAEGVGKAHMLRKILNNEALKTFEISSKILFSGSNNIRNNLTDQNYNDQHQSISNVDKGHHRSASGTDSEKCFDVLRHLIEQSEVNLVGHSEEESVKNPAEVLRGVALCGLDDVIQTNWQIDLLNSQLVLRCQNNTPGFILVTAARASVSQKIHNHVWRHAQLLTKKSWNATLSGMQYFAPLMSSVDSSAQNSQLGSQIYSSDCWLSKDIIEEKAPEKSTSRISDLFYIGEAVGGVVCEANDPLIANSRFQMQRVASRCSCQLFFCYYSDMLDIEMATHVKHQNPKKELLSKQDDEVDTFTLKHNILEVSTNPEQYQMFLNIVNNLILFVDPKKTESDGKRRRLWFEVANRPKPEVRSNIEEKQNELRENVYMVRQGEKRAFLIERELDLNPVDEKLIIEKNQLQLNIVKHKMRQNTLIDELAMLISCLKEKQVEEQIEAFKLLNKNPDDEDDELLIARRFEVFFENCIWRLTESDGQISIAEMQIRNFLYSRTAKVDNSGAHLLEIGVVKVLNLIPNSKYKEALCRLSDPQNSTGAGKSPSLRIICRECPPIGGIHINEHFEVNVAPMQAQITYKFFEKIMTYFFPGKNIEKEDKKDFDEPEDQQQQNYSLARRVMSSVTSSFIRREVIRTEKSRNQRNEIEKMKERSEKNKFVYIIIPSVPFIVSYKGNKEKNIEDVEKFRLIFPICEYHNKNWTWLDLALAVKQRCKRTLLQQLTHKLIRSRLLGPEPEPKLLTPEPLDDDAKRKMLLGVNAVASISKEKN